MVDGLLLALAVALCLIGAFKGRQHRQTGLSTHGWLAFVFGLLALAILVRVSPVYVWIGEAVGLQSLPDAMVRTALMGAAFGAQSLIRLVSMPGSPRSAWRGGRCVTLLVALAGLWSAFVVGHLRGDVVFGSFARAELWPTVYIVAFLGYMAVVAGDVMNGCWHYARSADGALRVGLRLMALGCANTLLYAVFKGSALVLAHQGSPVPSRVEAQIGQAGALLTAVPVAVGVALPALVRRAPRPVWVGAPVRGPRPALPALVRSDVRLARARTGAGRQPDTRPAPGAGPGHAALPTGHRDPRWQACHPRLPGALGRGSELGSRAVGRRCGLCGGCLRRGAGPGSGPRRGSRWKPRSRRTMGGHGSACPIDRHGGEVATSSRGQLHSVTSFGYTPGPDGQSVAGREAQMEPVLTASTGGHRVARVITEVFAPVVLIVVVTLVVSVHAAGAARGLGLALVAMTFAGGVPYAAILLGVRCGGIGDHHVSAREQRPRILAIGVISVALGLVVLHWLDAPRALFALLAAMGTGGVVSLAISTFWKISIHAASAAGTVACLAILVSRWWLWALPVIALTCWARVTLHDHTPAQVIIGAIVGAVVAAGVSMLLT